MFSSIFPAVARVLTAFSLAVAASAVASIDMVDIQLGSLQGGTYVNIYGSGFTRPGGATLSSSVEGQTTVFFGNDECDIIWYDTTDTKISCYSPPFAGGYDATVTIKVGTLRLDSYSLYATCATAVCRFSYRGSSTPQVSFWTGAGAAGKTFKATGYLIQPNAANYKIMAGGATCSIDTDNVAWADSTNFLWGNGNGEIICQIQDGVAGLYNTSFIATDASLGLGNALPLSDAWQVDPPTGTLFQYRAHPTVGYVSYNAVGLGGASSLTIAGSGFSWTPSENVVTLAGVPCPVTASTLNSLTCTPAAASSPTNVTASPAYPLGRGLLHTVLPYGSNWGQYVTPSVSLGTGNQWINTDSVKSYCTNCATNFVEDLQGFFVPPVTANYSFWTRGDDSTYVWLSPSANPSGVRLIASTPGATGSFYSYSQQISAPQYLVAGRPYYFQTRHFQGAGWSDFFVGLRIHTTGNAAATAAFASENQRVYDSVSDVQTVSVSVIPTRAQMTFYVVGVTASSTFVLRAGTSNYCPDCTNAVYFTADASTSSIANALGGFVGCWSFPVTRAAYTNAAGATGYKWTVTVNCPLGAAPPVLTPSPINFTPLAGSSPDVGSALTVAPSAPLGGSANFWYNSSIGANDSTPLVVSLSNPWGVASSLSQQLLSQPGVSRVTVSNTVWNCNGAFCDSLAWQIVFIAPYGNVPLLLADPSSLTGANATARAVTNVEGSTDTFLFPAPMDYFQYRAPSPGLTVSTKGILGDCPVGLCNFAYVAALTPTVTSVNATAVGFGSVLRITGTGFIADDLYSHNVSFGAAGLCEVVSATATQLVCVAGSTPAGTFPLVVEVLYTYTPGIPVGYATGAFNITVVQTISGFSPTSGSQAGGTLITIEGNGFAADGNNVVTVGGAPCAVVASSVSSVSCLTPANANTPTETVAAVLVNGISSGLSFAYSNSKTATLTSLAPLALSSALSGTITLQLTGVYPGAPISVAFGKRPCVLSSGSVTVSGPTTTVTCSLVRAAPLPLPQAPVPPTITIGAWGYALDGPFALDTGYRVDAMSVTAGSLLGGTVVTFTGVGFSAITYQDNIEFVHVDNWLYQWTTPCIISDITTTSLTCKTLPVSAWKRGTHGPAEDINGTFLVLVNNITAPCAASIPNCAFSMSARNTPQLAAVTETSSTMTLSGSLLGASAAGLKVQIGAYTCGGVQSLSPELASCVIPIGAAGPAAISVYVDGYGYANITSSANATHVFPLSVSSPLRVTSGSTAGGAVIILNGAGFYPDPPNSGTSGHNHITFGSSTLGAVEGFVRSSNETTLVVVVPPVYVAAVVDVSVYVQSADFSDTVAGVALPGAFSYVTGVTGTLSRVSPTSGSAGTRLVITGTSLGSANAANAVSIGGVACAVTGWTATQVNCTLGATPAGLHSVFVYTFPFGYATVGSVRFSASLAVSGVSGATSPGLGGGATLTLAGSGFAAVPSRNRVSLCNSVCNVTASTATSLTCTTGPLTTQAALSAFGIWNPSSALVGTSSVPAAVDLDVTVPFYGCSVVIDLGPQTLGVVASVSFFPNFQQSAYLAGAVFQGSLNGSAASYTTLYTVPAWAQQGWTNVPLYNGPGMPTTDLGTAPAYRYLRFQFAPGTPTAKCTAREIAFNGVPVAAQASGVCVPVVTVTPLASTDEVALFTPTLPPAVSANASSSRVSYSLSGTPSVTLISPSNGSSLGGDLVTISGTGFPATSADVSVAFNGVPCIVQTSSATAITCITGARPYGKIAPISVAVNVAGVGLALYDARYTAFRYLDRWSALTTWQFQEPPLEGDSVIIPPGQMLLVDVSPPKLFLVLVQGDLVFNNQDLTFDATYIFIYGGTFQAGTEDKPFMNQLTITLHGDRFNTIEIPNVGAKCLAVMSTTRAISGYGNTEYGVQAITWPVSTGYLDLHGRPRAKVWTRLSASAYAGDTVIRTVESVDYQPGETIVVIYIGDMNKAERVTVAALIDENTVELTAPLRYDHVGQIVSAQQYGFEDVYMFPEVGLLTRNIVVQGDDETSDKQLFGVHTGVFMGGVYRIENVELHRCGQQGALGRYCTHAHMLNNNFLSYVRHNSIHDSYQRAATIHATNYYTVENNFAFNIFGHTIFVEDGVERHNIIRHNLVVLTKPCIMCIASDTKPSNFWMQSPTNNWINNTAGGSTHFGYWFELGSSPSGPSRQPGYCPNSQPLGSFVGNTAHSSSIGLRIYPQYFPSKQPCGVGGDSPQYFFNSTVYANGLGVFHKHAAAVHHAYNRYVYNFGDGHHWKFMEAGYSWIPNVRDSLFMCGDGRSCGNKALWGPKTENFLATGLTIVNYANSGALAGCIECSSGEDYRQGGFTYRFGRMRFENSNVRIKWVDPYKEIFQDIDGSLSNQADGGWVVAPFAYNDWPECPRDRVGTFNGGNVCPATSVVRKISHDIILPTQLSWQNMNISSTQGWASVQFRPREYGGWVYPYVTGHSYMNGWVTPGQIDWRQFRIQYATPYYVDDNIALGGPTEWVNMGYTWINQRWWNQVSYPQLGGAIRPFQVYGMSPLSPALPIGSSNLPDGNKTWSVMINAVGANATTYADKYTFAVSALQCPPGGCPVPPPAKLGNSSLWSDPLTWGGLGVPVAGADVVINSTMYVIMDVNPPKLGRLTIYGRLDFQDSGTRSLNCDNIVVWGTLQVGSPAAPFRNNAEIVLYGNRYSPAVILNNNLFLQNKMMVVLGNLTMHGVPRRVTWTRLASTVAVGATSLTLRTSVAGVWYPGDLISISPTEYDHTQVENFTITGVSGATLTLDRAVRFRHYAGPASFSGPAASTHLGAVVALLNRNVVIRADLTDPLNDLYGAHVVVSSIRSAPGAKDSYLYMGTTDLRYMEFLHCGKWGDVYAALNIQYGAFQFDARIFDVNMPNYLEGVAFTASFNEGIDAVAAKSITVNASVFHQTYGYAMFLDENCQGATLVDTAFIGSYQSPLNNAPGQIEWVRPQSAVFFNVVPRRMTGNVVGGAVDTGFTWRPTACDAASLAAVTGNEAHSVRIGHWPLATRTRGGCSGVSGARVWKASHLGIFTVDSPVNVLVTGAFVAESHIGSSIAFLAASRSEISATYSDSTFVGATLAGIDCSVDATCRAETPSDVTAKRCGSVLGSGYRHAGILIPMFESTQGKTCEYNPMPGACTTPNIPERLCGMPWEKRYALPDASITNTAFYLTRVTFSNFNSSVCGMDSKAIVANPTEVDRNPPAYASGISWWGTPYEARFDFKTNSQTDSKCDGANCDAFYFLNFLDVDGTLTGGRNVPLETFVVTAGNVTAYTSQLGRTYASTAGSTVLGPNPLLAISEDRCPQQTTWNGATCVGVRYVNAFMTDVSSDSGHNALGPLEITRKTDPNDNTTWRTALSRATIDDMCPIVMRSSNYMAMIIPGTHVNFFWPATEPNEWRFQWLSKDPTDAAVVELFIQRPNAWELWISDIDGTSYSVPMMQVADRYSKALPTLDNATGTWLFNPQARRLWFTARGGSTTRYYDFVRKAAVQVTLLIAMPVEQFFGADLVQNLALLLSIDPSRIKVVDVRAGSTQADFVISDSQPTVRVGAAFGNATNATSAADAAALAAAQDAQTLRLLNLTQALQGAAAAGTLSAALGVPVLSMTFQPLPYNLSTGDVPAGAGSLGVPILVVTPSPSPSQGPSGVSGVLGGSSGSSAGGLSPGAVAGIAVGCAAAVLIAVIVALVVVRSRRSGAKDPVVMTTNKASRGSFETYAAGGEPVKMHTNRHYVGNAVAQNAGVGGRPAIKSVRASFEPTATHHTQQAV